MAHRVDILSCNTFTPSCLIGSQKNIEKLTVVSGQITDMYYVLEQNTLDN